MATLRPVYLAVVLQAVVADSIGSSVLMSTTEFVRTWKRWNRTCSHSLQSSVCFLTLIHLFLLSLSFPTIFPFLYLFLNKSSHIPTYTRFLLTFALLLIFPQFPAVCGNVLRHTVLKQRKDTSLHFIVKVCHSTPILLTLCYLLFSGQRAFLFYPCPSPFLDSFYLVTANFSPFSRTCHLAQPTG